MSIGSPSGQVPETTTPVVGLIFRPAFVSQQLVEFLKEGNVGYGGSDIAAKFTEGFDITREQPRGTMKRPDELMGQLFDQNIASTGVLIGMMELYIKVNNLRDVENAAYFHVDSHLLRCFGEGTNTHYMLNGQDQTPAELVDVADKSGLQRLRMKLEIEVESEHETIGVIDSLTQFDHGLISFSDIKALLSYYKVKWVTLTSQQKVQLTRPETVQSDAVLLEYVVGAIERRPDGGIETNDFANKRVKGLLDYQHEFSRLRASSHLESRVRKITE